MKNLIRIIGPGTNGRSNGAIKRKTMLMALLILSGSQALSEQPEKGPTALHKYPSELKPYVVALGQRLQKPGRERITAIGTISYDNGNPISVQIIWQFPLKIRLDQEHSILTFDRSNPAASVPGSQETAATIQVLLEDSVEGFIGLQKNRISRRYLGSGFRLDGAKTSDPGVDIIEMTYPNIFGHGQSIQKSYWFNTRTKLLGVVAYKSSSDTLVHIILDDWHNVDGENVPFLIERWVNGNVAMRLTIFSAAVSPGLDDGIFGGN